MGELAPPDVNGVLDPKGPGAGVDIPPPENGLATGAGTLEPNVAGDLAAVEPNPPENGLAAGAGPLELKGVAGATDGVDPNPPEKGLGAGAVPVLADAPNGLAFDAGEGTVFGTEAVFAPTAVSGFSVLYFPAILRNISSSRPAYLFKSSGTF